MIKCNTNIKYITLSYLKLKNSKIEQCRLDSKDMDL